MNEVPEALVDEEERLWDWTKNPKQDAFIWDRSRFKAWVAGRGGTKTSSAVFSIFTTCYDPETGAVRPEWKGARIALFAPVSKQLKRGPLEKFDEIMGEMGLITHKVDGHDPRRELVGDIILYAFNVGPDGSGVEATRGAEYALGWLDEAAQMPEKTFALANALLRQKRRNGASYAYQLLITTTPRGKNWVDTKFMSRVPKGPGSWHRDTAFIVRGTTLESIEAGILSNDYVENMGYAPGTLMHAQEILGESVSWGGLVFPEFNFTRHVQDPFTPPPLQFVYGGIDVGTSDPTCLLVAGMDASGGIWFLDEYYERRAKFDDWADLAGQWDKKYAVRLWSVDSDLTVRMLKHAGLRAKTPYKAKDAKGVAINYINNKFAKNQIHISPKCKNYIRELETYHHKEDTKGDEPTILGTIATGQDDHGCDAAQYLITPLSSASAAQQYGKSVEMSYG